MRNGEGMPKVRGCARASALSAEAALLGYGDHWVGPQAPKHLSPVHSHDRALLIGILHRQAQIRYEILNRDDISNKVS